MLQQKTKSKILDSNNYPTTCFHYIHQNPWRANLVIKMEDWPYSSFQDYLEGESTICNIAMARELLEVPARRDQFYKDWHPVIDRKLINPTLTCLEYFMPMAL